MLHDAAVRVIVTRQSLLDRLPNHSAPRVCLDRDSEESLKRKSPLVLPSSASDSGLRIYTWVRPASRKES